MFVALSSYCAKSIDKVYHSPAMNVCSYLKTKLKSNESHDCMHAFIMEVILRNVRTVSILRNYFLPQHALNLLDTYDLPDY